ncbi:16575_t:CDS:10 [Acaulospora morrowiae]|uniref:16575_t:CDS:1 n=1 Tax=Acaulospora morrowiae TaxID=94023 RepID=A0A9N8W8E8_9GLOM|nr:16575_t:CDS:10 [Acaulospora morrowiae]
MLVLFEHRKSLLSDREFVQKQAKMIIDNKVFVAGTINSNKIWDDSKKEQKTQEGDLNENANENGATETRVYGRLLSIINANRPPRHRVKETHNRPIAFGCFCFAPASLKSGPSDFQSGFFEGLSMLEEAMHGTLMMAVADQRGSVIIIDFGSNKFWQITRIGIAASAIAFTPLMRNELVISFTDNSIRCYNSESRQLIAEMRGHKKPVDFISMHPKRHIAITCSPSEAILWNMIRWSKLKILSRLKEGVALRRGELIITSFYDETIYFWSCSSFDLLWRLQTPVLIPNQLLSFSNVYDVATKNERMIIVAGKKTLYIWDYDIKDLIYDINLDAIFDGEIVKFEPVRDNAYLLVLSSDGTLMIVDIFQSELSIHILNAQYPVKFFEVSPDGKFLATNAMKERSVITIWDLEALISDTLQQRNLSVSRITMSQNEHSLEERRSPENLECAGGSNPSFVSHFSTGPEPEEVTGLTHCSSVSSMNSFEIEGFSTSSRRERRKKLVQKLKELGNYPENHRVRIWRVLLDLPQNQRAFKGLMKGLNPAVKIALSKNPNFASLSNLKISMNLEQFLSALIRWGYDESVVVRWMPSMIFPFLETLSEIKDNFSFEIILSLLLNWFQNCWEEFPNPPSRILNVAATLLEHWDMTLHAHFLAHGIKIQDCYWKMMHWSLAKVLTRENWILVWNHLFSSDEPSLMYYFMLAFIINQRGTILKFSRKKDLLGFFDYINSIDILHVLRLTYKLESETPLWLSPRFEVGRYKPLTKTGPYRLDYSSTLTRTNDQKDEIRDWILEQEREIVKKRIVFM